MQWDTGDRGEIMNLFVIYPQRQVEGAAGIFLLTYFSLMFVLLIVACVVLVVVGNWKFMFIFVPGILICVWSALNLLISRLHYFGDPWRTSEPPRTRH